MRRASAGEIGRADEQSPAPRLHGRQKRSSVAPHAKDERALCRCDLGGGALRGHQRAVDDEGLVRCERERRVQRHSPRKDRGSSIRQGADDDAAELSRRLGREPGQGVLHEQDGRPRREPSGDHGGATCGDRDPRQLGLGVSFELHSNDRLVGERAGGRARMASEARAPRHVAAYRPVGWERRVERRAGRDAPANRVDGKLSRDAELSARDRTEASASFEERVSPTEDEQPVPCRGESKAIDGRAASDVYTQRLRGEEGLHVRMISEYGESWHVPRTKLAE